MTMVKKNLTLLIAAGFISILQGTIKYVHRLISNQRVPTWRLTNQEGDFLPPRVGVNPSKIPVGKLPRRCKSSPCWVWGYPIHKYVSEKTWLFSSCDAWHPQVANSKTHKAPPNANTPFDIGGTSATFDLDCRDRHEIHFLGWWNHQKSTTSNIWTGSSSEIELPTDPHNWSCLVFTHPFWYMLMVYVCILSHSYLVC